tara:strand:+ start:174 stop:425 length:252 start_codon:yes stop_codon:yes gene_type:complete
MKYPIYRVRWIDSSVQDVGEWVFVNDVKRGVMEIESVGYLFDRQPNSIILVSSYSDWSDDHQVDHPLTIPMEAIKEMEEIRGV